MSSNTTQRVDEEFLHQLMTAARADVQNQLDVIMEGIGHRAYGPCYLRDYPALSQAAPGPWIVADWKALRTNAGRATLIRKYQRPFTFLRDDERNRCARFLLSCAA